MRDTTRCRRLRGATALFAVLACLLAAVPARAQDAYAAFQDGNRLFRDDLYWAALLRYREAAAAGMDTSLLHFNTGVAHYRAQQHIRARQSLLKAAQDPRMRVIAHYNLGLNAYSAGDLDEALGWFRQARDQEQNEKLREFAMIAITRINNERRETDPVLIAREQREEKKKPPASFELYGRVGFGNDDNVFRSPDRPYVDQSDPNLPLVTPEVQSGAFVPVDFRAKYSINSLKWESFFGEYRLSGRYYQDQEIEEANEYIHELRFGSEFDKREEGKRARIYSAFTIAQHDETYYDPDTGTPRMSAGGEDLSDRMNYVRYGPQLSFQRGWEKFSLGLRMKGELWDYESTQLVAEYDHEYFLFGAHMQHKFAPTSLLRFTVEKSSRRYNDRRAYNENGELLINNPSLRYDYLKIGLLARQRITDTAWFGFGYDWKDREDRFVGYNDFTRDSYNFEVHWTPNRRFDLDFRGYYRIYDFPNAFAFHNPAAGAKTFETVDFELGAMWRFTNNLSINAQVEYRGTSSTDTRIQYDRTLYALGVTWEM